MTYILKLFNIYKILTLILYENLQTTTKSKNDAKSCNAMSYVSHFHSNYYLTSGKQMYFALNYL